MSPKNRRISGPVDDTPEDGTPAFDELDASLKKKDVPLAAPTPDHAEEYYSPRNLPKRAGHRTFEMQPVKVSPHADPRRAPTVKNLRTLQKEAAAGGGAAAAAGGVATAGVTSGAADRAVPDSVGPVVGANDTASSRTAGVVTAAIAGGLLLIALVLLVATRQPEPEVESIAEGTAAPTEPVAQTQPPSPPAKPKTPKPTKQPAATAPKVAAAPQPIDPPLVAPQQPPSKPATAKPAATAAAPVASKQPAGGPLFETIDKSSGKTPPAKPIHE